MLPKGIGHITSCGYYVRMATCFWYWNDVRRRCRICRLPWTTITTVPRIKTLGTCRTVLYIQQWMEMYDVYCFHCHSYWQSALTYVHTVPIVCSTYRGIHRQTTHVQLHIHIIHMYTVYRVPHMCKIQFEAAPFLSIFAGVCVCVC